MGFGKGNSSDIAGSIYGMAEDFAIKQGGKPPAGEAVGAQNVGTGNLASPGIPAMLYQNAGGGIGGGAGNGLGGLLPGAIPGLGFGIGGSFWGFGGGTFVQPRKGTYAAYRMMSTDPTLRLIRSLIWSPIIASQWTIQAAEGIEVSTGQKFVFDPITGRCKQVPQTAIDFIRDQMFPLRSMIVREALRGLEFGWRPFERVYKIGRGGPNEGRFYQLEKCKGLLPEFCNILHDGFGNFGGLTVNAATSVAAGGLAPNKSWIYTYDGEAGNLYGLSRHEAAYDAWVDTQQTRVRQYMLMCKLSGVLPTLYYRPGNTLINGQLTDNFVIAKQIVAVAYAGGAAVVPTTEYTDSDLQANPELAKIAPWRLEIVNAGSYSPAMDGMIKEREYQDKLKIRGWGWPERAAIEASHGGLGSGDAGDHTDSATLDLEAVDSDIAAQCSQGQPAYSVPGVVDELLRLNYGDGTQGSIIINPSPLSDPKVAMYQKFVDTVFANPSLAPIFAQIPDWESIFQHLDVKCAEDIHEKMPSLIDTANQQAQAKAVVPQKGGLNPDGDPIQPELGPQVKPRITGLSGSNGKSAVKNGKPK